MVIKTLFVTSDRLVSRLIRAVTDEPVSHCAIQVGEFVIHSSFLGVKIESIYSFNKQNRVIKTLEFEVEPKQFKQAIARLEGKGYDFGALFYLLMRYIIPWVPKINLWQTSGMYLCTEFVTQLLTQKEDSLVTPYKLYLNLLNSENK